MGPIQVIVEDGNNVILEVTPTPDTNVILDRGIAGPTGPQGPTGAAATIAAGTTTTLAPGSSATVTNAGTSSAAVFNFGIPEGLKGDAATIAVGTTTTVAPGSPANVTNSGTSDAAVFNFEIPQGVTGNTGPTGPQGPIGLTGNAATIAAGTTTTISPGSPATVTNVGTSSAAVFDFAIPQGLTGNTGPTGATGAPGMAASVSVGNTTTLAPGSTALVTNSGTSSAAVLDFGIPAGETGTAATIAVGTTTTLAAGSSATVTNVGSNAAAIFNFGIPKGADGTGSGSVTSVDVSGGTTGLTTSGGPVTVSGTISLGGTLATTNGGTGLTSYTPNGILYASGSGTLATGSVLTFNGTNVINSGAYTAPSNGAGAGTKTTILGSTGTGQAGPSGGNGFIELVGGGGTSLWTNFFTGANMRRRGGINLQAGTAQGDAGGTFISGSTIDIRGSNGTNNGTSVGTGSTINLFAGSTLKLDGSSSNGAFLFVNGGNSVNSGGAALGAGTFTVSGVTNNNSLLSLDNANATRGGLVDIFGGNASVSGATGGSVNLKAGNSTGVAGANVVLTSGTGTANGKISFVVGALGEVVQISPTGAIGFSGTNYGTTGQALVSQGSGSAPVWGSVSGGLTYIFTTTPVTATDKQGVLTSTAGGSFTVTLPVAPSVGAQVVIADAGNNWGTNNLTVDRNGSTIGNLAENLTCDITGASVQFVFDGTTWEVYTQIGGQGGSVVTLTGVQTITNKTMDYNSNTFLNFPAAAPFSSNIALAQVQATALCF